MERLTKWYRNEDGVTVAICTECPNLNWFANCIGCETDQKVFDRLAEYEDSGLTPEEIMRLKEGVKSV